MEQLDRGDDVIDRPDAGRFTGEPGDDVDEVRVLAAAQELVIAAGRPAGWVIQSEYEREAWCQVVRRVLRAYAP